MYTLKKQYMIIVELKIMKKTFIIFSKSLCKSCRLVDVQILMRLGIKR